MAKIEYKSVDLLGQRVDITINHRDRSISARLGDWHGRMESLRATLYMHKRLALGASLRVNTDAEEEVTLGAFVGPLRLFIGLQHRALGRMLKRIKADRRVTDLELYTSDNYEGDSIDIILRGHLWDDDSQGNEHSRAIYWNLVRGALGAEVRIGEEELASREVLVPLPEGSFRTTARLMQRCSERPRWPFRHYRRWVEFDEVWAVVPSKSDSHMFFNMGSSINVTGRNIEDGVGELVKRILEQRAKYGGAAWREGIPPAEHWRSSHKVSVWKNVEGAAREAVVEGDLHHGSRMIIHGNQMAIHNDTPHVSLGRDPLSGGLVLSSSMPMVIHRGDIPRRRAIPVTSGLPVRLLPGDLLELPGGEMREVYGMPIGPEGQVQHPGSVRVADLTSVNKGPAIGRAGRIPLEGLTFEQVAIAVAHDTEWCAANPGIVAGAKPGMIYVNGGWTTAEFETSGAGREAETAAGLAADVAEVAAQLDTSPPSPSEEGEGVAAREAALGYLHVDGEGAATETTIFSEVHLEGVTGRIAGPVKPGSAS